jgi:hypothetical protein
MRQLLEAISTLERLRDFWQRNLVTIAMLKRYLPDLKTEKGEHYAEILTSLYKLQMRVVWEEARADERSASKLADEGGGANARRQKAQGQATHDSALRPQETTRRSLEQYKDPAERSAEPSGAKTAQPNDQQLDDGEGDVKQSGHKDGCAAKPSAAIGTDRDQEQRVENPVDGSVEKADAGSVDKTSLTISALRRVRDKEHLRYVASQPCIICARAPGQAHHLRFAQPRALGRKVGDDWTVPLCATHHRALHSVGDEETWWKEKGIDPIAHAVRFWWDTRHGGIEDPTRITGAGRGIVFSGRDGPLKVGKPFGPSAQTAGRIKDAESER